MTEPLTPTIRPPDYLSGGKRTNLRVSEWLPGWWVGFGKDESCQFEGPWYDIVILAAKVLRDPATAIVAPNLYRPDLVLTAEQERNYTEGPSVEWPEPTDD
jgi:hypothetical protein